MPATLSDAAPTSPPIASSICRSARRRGARVAAEAAIFGACSTDCAISAFAFETSARSAGLGCAAGGGRRSADRGAGFSSTAATSAAGDGPAGAASSSATERASPSAAGSGSRAAAGAGSICATLAASGGAARVGSGTEPTFQTTSARASAKAAQNQRPIGLLGAASATRSTAGACAAA